MNTEMLIYFADNVNYAINTVHRVEIVIKVMVQLPQAIEAQCHEATEKSHRLKSQNIVQEVVLVLAQNHTSQGEEIELNIRVEILAKVPGIVEAKNIINDVQHQETIDEEVSQMNADATTIDPGN